MLNYGELRNLLFEDLRIDERELHKMNAKDIALLADKYGSTNIKKLSGLLGRL